MKTWKIVLISIASVILLISLSFAFGWVDVFSTKTVGKAKQNVQREIFEQTQSYVEGKRQEALKYYREYTKSDEDGKQAIKEIVAQSFANFDEEKLNGKVKLFVYNCKYNP